MPVSTAYILVRAEGGGKAGEKPAYSRKYTFDGVVSVSHTLSLKVSTDTDASEDSDYVNNARNEPDVVTLSVVASDAAAGAGGASVRALRELAEIKEKRRLCRVVTRLRTSDNMLLTDLSVLQDETCPCGWTGTLTFTRTNPPKKRKKERDQSSTPEHKGMTTPKKPGTGTEDKKSVLLRIFRETGIPT